MKIVVIYNPKSGSKSFSEENFKLLVSTKLKNSDFEFEFMNIHNNKIDIERLIKNKNQLKAVLISGGDGTISSFIKIGVETNIPIGIIPNGTFNNFAQDNNIPLEIEDALNTIALFNTKEIDVAMVNDKYFVNNSSIGLYVHSVKIRERTKKIYKLNKLTTMFFAIIRIFYLFPMIYVEIKSDGKSFKSKTPFVFVGNNKYQFDLLSLGERKSLTKGKLYVHFSKCKYRFCLIKIGFKALINRLYDEKDLIINEIDEIVISSKKKKINVAADGEIYQMNSPLRYKIIPKAIKLIVPVE